MAKIVNIHGEKVPNPDSIKFTISNFLLTKGAYQFDSPESAERSPLAKKLFGFDYMERVFISKNFVTVTKKPDSGVWESMLIDLRIVIKKHLEQGEPLFNFTDTAVEEDPKGDSLPERIERTINDHIRPATWQDGGDLKFLDFSDGTVTVGLSGACVRCPFISRTIKHGVEVILKRHFPEVTSVTSADVDWANTQQEETPNFQS